MSIIRAHFDGKVFVPDEQVDIPPGAKVQVMVLPSIPTPSLVESTEKGERRPLAELISLLESLPHESSLPPDASMNVDHYLYGAPKQSD